jgi:L-threonylcarbamoyladenylate synthase
LAAPSANRFGRISPTSAEAVKQELGGKIPYILDGGPCQYGVESTVLAIDTAGKLTLLRPGALARETIAQELSLTVHVGDAEDAIKASPGMLKSHYAPECSVVLLESSVNRLTQDDWRAVRTIVSGRSCGMILTSGGVESVRELIETSLHGQCTIHTLSETGNDREAARRLFATLRELDAMDLDLILVERCPSEDGLWLAIADRLRRASG